MSAAMVGVGYDPLRDKVYRLTRLGGPIVDHLASKQQLGRSDETLDAKERTLAAFATMWPDLAIGQVEVRHCAHYLSNRNWNAEHRRVQRSHLNQFFEWAIRWDLIERNPLGKLEPQSRAKKKVKRSGGRLQQETPAQRRVPRFRGELGEAAGARGATQQGLPLVWRARRDLADGRFALRRLRHRDRQP